ncbi:hypothetical protein Arub01_01220 [Actinomadura rubrobrunea]|uniref:Double-GTPase 2 domain-containing protein n=1 Tax=Actinomadura rubrobrunea TaxID=115335 RepID=A0A9W6UTL0_9ACTN|nr:hypothetical protein [Actinomadura rubrobrunea]GLW61878.1 hypothetical protein Arub01_01220 [Actinomadura rubrobrunea]
MPSFASNLICPYCYQPFPARKVLFRCTGLLGPKGERCAPARDPALSRRFGMNEPLPPVFGGRLPVVNALRTAARCPRCGGESTLRVCPHCHSQLPVHFGRVDSRLIALIGAKGSGKTVYMTVLLHELMHSVGRRFDAAVVGSDDHTRSEFSKKYEETLYRRNVLPGTTRPGQAELRRPLVFKVTLDGGRRLLRARDRHTITSFFDTAGEDLISRRSVDLNVRYLRAADGIILLLDPLQMRGARAGVRPGTPLPELDERTDSPVNVLTRVTEVLHEAHGLGPSRRIDVPVAVAFSKIDALRHAFPPDSPLLRDPPEDRPVFDQTDSLAVHDHVRALLHEWDGAQIDQIMRRNYAAFRYFGLSSLGGSPTADNRVDPRGIHPYRVADPFLWLLSRFGAVPSTKG